MLPNFITGLIQTAIIFAFGIVGLQLLGLTPATLGNEPLATVLVVMLPALCSSAFGILIAALARTEGQIGGLSNLLLWGMGLLGGSLIPLFILERILGLVPMVVPHYWANRALVDLMPVVRDVASTNWLMLAFGLPAKAAPLFLIPLLTTALTVGLLVFAVLTWGNGGWSTVGRVHYSLVTLAALAFVWFLNYWDLSGFWL